MGKWIVLGLAGIAAIAFYRNSSQRDWQPSPAFQRIMGEARERTHHDTEGPLGQAAREACGRVAGVSNAQSMRTIQDLSRAGYDDDTALKFVDCTVNYMYPVDASTHKRLGDR